MSSRVDVALDARQTSHMSAGTALYVRELAARLPGVAPDLRFACTGSGDNFDLAEQVGLPLAIARLHPRLVHLPTVFVPVAIPAPFVLTIHDLIDLHYPQFVKRKVGPYYRFCVAPVARRARAVITDDERTITDLTHFLGVDPGRIRIVPLGVELAAPGPPLVRERPFFLYVGNARPHKNLGTLVRAWNDLPADVDVDLLFTGSAPADTANLRATRTNGRIIFAGRCTPNELAALYRAAAAYVHPALREGFGLPMLEAMRAGTPVIAAREALPAPLAAHAHVFAATDWSGLRDLLAAVLRERTPFARVAAAATAATAALTWDRTARSIADVYREFLA